METLLWWTSVCLNRSVILAILLKKEHCSSLSIFLVILQSLLFSFSFPFHFRRHHTFECHADNEAWFVEKRRHLLGDSLCHLLSGFLKWWSPWCGLTTDKDGKRRRPFAWCLSLDHLMPTVTQTVSHSMGTAMIPVKSPLVKEEDRFLSKAMRMSLQVSETTGDCTVKMISLVSPAKVSCKSVLQASFTLTHFSWSSLILSISSSWSKEFERLFSDSPSFSRRLVKDRTHEWTVCLTVCLSTWSCLYPDLSVKGNMINLSIVSLRTLMTAIAFEFSLLLSFCWPSSLSINCDISHFAAERL